MRYLFIFRWYISQWSPCSKTCGVGIHTRRVHCVETIKDGNIRMLDFGDCAGSVPITVDQCVVQQNCPQWLEMKWTQVRMLYLIPQKFNKILFTSQNIF